MNFRLMSARHQFWVYWRRRHDKMVRAFLRGQIQTIRDLEKRKP